LIPRQSDLPANALAQSRGHGVVADGAPQIPFHLLACLERGGAIRTTQQMPVDLHAGFNEQLAADISIQDFIHSLANHRFVEASLQGILALRSIQLR
jgi:hypothetical protein